MFSRSTKRKSKKMVEKVATIKIIKPEQETNEPAFDLSKAVITIVKPDSGLKIKVEETEEGEEDE